MRSVVVVDTNIMVKWVVNMSDSEAAKGLLIDWIKEERTVLAPALLTYEACNALYYLALAEREKCEFWTSDTRLWKAVHTDLPWVHNLGEYSTS